MSKVTEVLAKLDIPYKTQGQDYVVKCFNPEHTDSHPSMRIDIETGIYNCFACGHKGNLLQENGVRLSPVDRRVMKILKKIGELKTVSLDIPEGATMYTSSYRGISAETLQYYKAFTHPDYPDRIMFPLYNISNELVVMIGRHMFSNVEAKYKFYPGHTTPPIFPAKPLHIYDNSIILVEGIFDALNLIDKGLQNVVTGFGTTTFLKKGSDKLSHLKIFNVDKIYIMFDGDTAGREAAKKLENLINKTGMFEAEVIDLPDGVDPGDLTTEDVLTIKRSMYNEGSYS